MNFKNEIDDLSTFISLSHLTQNAVGIRVAIGPKAQV